MGLIHATLQLLHSAILGRSPSAAFSHLTWLERYAMDSHKQWYTHIHKDTYMEVGHDDIKMLNPTS